MASIKIYKNFAKRYNSTKQPSSGTDITVTLKDTTSIAAPTFILTGGLSAYDDVTAVFWDGRYYKVDDVRSEHNNVTEIVCKIDRMATYKSRIGSSSQFIERCADSYNSALRDENCLTSSQTFTSEMSSAGSLFPDALTDGIIVCAIANILPSQALGGTAQCIIFDAGSGTYSISQLMSALYDNGVKASIEKILNKPYDAILSVRYIPGFKATTIKGWTTFIDDNSVVFGDHLYSGTLNCIKCAGTAPWTYEATEEFDLSSIAYYSTFKWRNYEPYASWTLYLPFYGTVPINAAEYLNHESGDCNLLIKATVDMTTGEMVYTRYWRVVVGGVTTDYFAQEYRTTIGVEIPIQGSNRDGLAFTADLAVAAGTVGVMVATGGATLPLAGAAAGAAGKAVVDAYQQSILTAGSFNAHGTQICTAEPNKISIVQKGYITPVSPSSYAAELGLPLMEADTISNHSGFIKCRNAAVEIPGTDADRQEVNAMLNSGFFYE